VSSTVCNEWRSSSYNKASTSFVWEDVSAFGNFLEENSVPSEDLDNHVVTSADVTETILSALSRTYAEYSGLRRLVIWIRKYLLSNY
jgi:hypothetical protein